TMHSPPTPCSSCLLESASLTRTYAPSLRDALPILKAKFSERGNMLLPQETGWMTNGLHSDLTTRNIICGYTLQTAFTASSGEITTKKRSWSAAATNGSKRTVRRSAAICLSIFITPQGKQKRYSCET